MFITQPGINREISFISSCLSSLFLLGLYFGTAQGKPMEWTTMERCRFLLMKKKLGTACHVEVGTKIYLWGRYFMRRAFFTTTDLSLLVNRGSDIYHG
jgi:hypothetical protein